MKRGTILLIVFVAVAGLIVAAGATIMHDGMSARASPTKLEEFVARHLWHLSIPAGARAAQNPVPNTPENLREAMLHFADHCAVCHGNDGSGDGVFGRGLYPKPPDLRQTETQSRSDGELFWIIENGVRFTGMPAFSGHGPKEDSWKLVNFIRHLPRLTAEERIEMGRYNPKSLTDREEDKQEDEFLKGTQAPKKTEPPHTHP
jgi:mono/diheme cytochrome c family protein